MTHFIIDTIKYYPFTSLLVAIIFLIIMRYATPSIKNLFNILFTFPSKIENLKVGKVEIKARVSSINSIDDLDKKAVYYKQVSENYEKGKNGGWKTLSSSEEFLSFKAVDDTGEVMIVPDSDNNFNIKFKTVKHGKIIRTKYYYLEDNEDVYIMGYYDGEKISSMEGFPFLISNFKEIILILKNALYGFGSIFLAISLVSLGLFLASIKWNKDLEGPVKNKYINRSSKGFPINHYMIDLSNIKLEITKTEYDKIKINDYIIKKKKSYNVFVKGD